MNFRPGSRDEPEINLIPFIDILLVVLIFMVLTTTYSKYTELQVSLPVADALQPKQRPTEVLVSVAQDGRYAVNGSVLDGANAQLLSAALRQAAPDAASHERTVVVINADASATHQAVIAVMDAARQAGLTQITFSTQSPAGGGSASPGRRP
jgi:biopolymer transport protein ExbD